MPVDYVDATLILDDGERSEVIFFVHPNEDVAQLVSSGKAFIPVMRSARICIVARDAIAAIGVAPRAPSSTEGELPSEKQLVTVKLRSGMLLEGELSWTVVPGQQRTADFLNTESPVFELRTVDKSYYVLKSHVATVQEK